MPDNVDFSKRNLLRGRPLGDSALRPPWAIAEGGFAKTCTTCDDCIKACEEQIIVRGSGGYPEVDFNRGACTFCGECVDACDTAALSRDNQAPWQLQLSISDRCLARRQVVCQTCGDICDERAIRFRPALGKVAQPAVNDDLCTGCGACIAACPEQALTLQPVDRVDISLDRIAVHE